ncbi:SGNH hydrolase-type esterase domain-containing protein [Truncatella angustata]|uniref:SGNH hydrolase-type esterase domain-containing protein n=1 Tax=Truncatella angustata TaxID=152316 RepID=A0A9P8ZWP4_9PEZI|nr:SGNH hydrolase-type esterase domain-containing protein [Truncatella angustata]KAH6653162.1 SGNH hydrolase-type esterase domain-containing protein [Truncatella angustata]
MGSTIASDDENQSLTISEFNRLLQCCAKYKQHSLKTSRDDHIPLLISGCQTPSIVLLGDSMIERMQTTRTTPGLHSWPSETFLDDASLKNLTLTSGAEIERLQGVLNAGVGGDKYENILYRLLGDPARQLRGLTDVLSQNNITLWVIHAGTNNLRSKRGLSDESVDLMRLLLQAVLRISKPGTNILVTGLFYRTDILDRLVSDANAKLKLLVRSMNGRSEKKRIVFVPPPTSVGGEHLEDHVHLNTEGYRLWIEYLLPKVSSHSRSILEN